MGRHNWSCRYKVHRTRTDKICRSHSPNVFLSANSIIIFWRYFLKCVETRSLDGVGFRNRLFVSTRGFSRAGKEVVCRKRNGMLDEEGGRG